MKKINNKLSAVEKFRIRMESGLGKYYAIGVLDNSKQGIMLKKYLKIRESCPQIELTIVMQSKV